MKTSKLHDTDVSNEAINGPRPSPLRINKDSHAIHKSSSFPAASFPSHHHHPVSGGGAAKNNGSVKRPPVIIYTQSPRIIHTQAHEFMTLVQKLTGLDRAVEEKEEINHAKSDESESTPDEGSISNDDNKDNAVAIKNNDNSNINNIFGYEENESSSVLTTDDKFVAHDSSPVSSMYKVSTNNMNNNPYLNDGGFLGSGSSDFYCSSRSNSMFGSANNHPISPSFMDVVMKGFPEY